MNLGWMGSKLALLELELQSISVKELEYFLQQSRAWGLCVFDERGALKQSAKSPERGRLRQKSLRNDALSMFHLLIIS